MKTGARIAGMVAGITGLLQLVLGVLIWTGHALGLVNLHMLVGFIFVLALWTLCGLGLAAGLGARHVALPLVWGLVVPALGMTQMQLLPGSFHWVINGEPPRHSHGGHPEPMTQFSR